MLNWIYQDKLFTTEDIPDGAIGFVYCLTHIPSGKKYIGQKRFWKRIKKKPLKGKKRNRIEIKESDWKTYLGSSNQVKDIIENESDSFNFKREILHICYSKGELNYMELKEQVDRDVLLKPDQYFNSIIQVRINRLHLIKKD